MTKPASLKTLLVVSPENSKVASQVFDSTFKIEVVTSLATARNLLSSTYELIVATTCFDESRMFDLLRYCKAHPDSQMIPFVAMRIDGLHMDDITHQAIQIATKALGAEEYIDLQRLAGTLHEKSIVVRELLTMFVAKKRLDI